MDKDFGELVYNSGLKHSGVLILRLEDANSEQKLEVVKKILGDYADKIQNRFCVFQDGRLRIKK
jgi:predicted nuclease of predicted toxin-antitoxin system